MVYKKKFISVIIPVYNSEKFIDEALESVIKATDNRHCEIIAIDDGSTDDSLQVLKKWSNKIKIISQSNKGPSAARNAGIKKAKGEYIAFIDADDIWTPNHIKVLLSEFNKNKNLEINMGYSQRFMFTQKNKLIGGPILFPTFGSALFKASVFKKIGLLEEKYHWHEDIDWYFKAREQKIKIAITKKLVVYYRIHDHNTTASWSPTDKKILYVLKSSLDRRKNISLPALKDFINES